jgi:hypothetical protein
MSYVFEKQKLQIVRTHFKITQIKQEKTQSYTSLQGASYEHKLKKEFLPLQAIFDDFVLIFCSKLASKVSIEAH